MPPMGYPAATRTETAPAVAPTPATETLPATPASDTSAAPSGNTVLAAVRLLMKETRTGGFSGKLDRVAEELKKSADDLVAALVGAGLKVPERAKEKPVFVEHAGEIFWFNKNAKEELWLNAKASKFAEKDGETDDGDAEKKPARRSSGGGGRSRTKKD